MKKLNFYGLAVLLIVLPLRASADMTGNQLADICRKVDPVITPGTNLRPTDTLEALSCAQFISGYVDGQDILKKLDFATLPYCLPPRVPVSQLIKIVVKRINAYPEHLHFAATMIVLRAFMDAFPCEK